MSTNQNPWYSLFRKFSDGGPRGRENRSDNHKFAHKILCPQPRSCPTSPFETAIVTTCSLLMRRPELIERALFGTTLDRPPSTEKETQQAAIAEILGLLEGVPLSVLALATVLAQVWQATTPVLYKTLLPPQRIGRPVPRRGRREAAGLRRLQLMVRRVLSVVSRGED